MRKIIVLIIGLIFIISCENGLIGLGDKVDIDSPQITIGNYSDGSPISNADYVRGIIILSGTVKDDIGVSSVNITIVDTATLVTVTGSADLDFTAMTWSYTIDSASFKDGEKEITIEVLDTSSSPKTDTVQRVLFFDNTAPMVLVTVPVGYTGSGYTDMIKNIKGETYDQFQVKEVNVSLISGSGTIDPIAGTASWSTALRSSGSGLYELLIRATDLAGNVSEGFYHLDDILTENDSVYLTIKEIFDIREGSLVQNSGLKQSDLTSTGILLTELPIRIDLSGDEPQISLSNPDPNAAAIDNVLPGNAKAIGSITDDDGIDTATIQIKIESVDGLYNPGWVDVENVKGSGLFVKWDHSLASLEGKAYTMQVRADDIYGVSKESSLVNFSINIGAPEIAITYPAIGDYLNNGTFTITGTADDITGGVNQMEISIDDGVSWNIPTVFTASDHVNWSHNVAGRPDGNMLIKVRATDDGSAWSYSNLQVIIDTEDPTNSMLYPGHNSYVNGLVEIRGASSDNTQLSQVEVRIGDDDSWIVIPEENRYNWIVSINSLNYENESDSNETSPGSGVWDLNIYTRITDIAGNVVETGSGDYVIKIDNSLDRPTVNIISPYDGQSIGGAVLVSGTSFDDDGAVFGVYMQIDVNTPSGGTPDFAESVTLSHAIDFDGDGPEPAVITINESAWYPLNGKNPWSLELNSHGELYSTAGGHSGDLHIKIKAKDKDGGAGSIFGEEQTLHIKMDDTVPYFTELPTADEYKSGSFKITGHVLDDRSIKTLKISYNGGAQYHDIVSNENLVEPSFVSGSVTKEGHVIDYALAIPIDTSNIPDVGTLSSDSLSIRLKVIDDTNYQTLYSLRYLVDNTLPKGTSSNYNNISGSGNAAIISGTADDIGLVKGINHVEAYIIRNSNFYNPRNYNDFIVATTKKINGVDCEYPTGVGYENYLFTIDNTSETLSGANADTDGIAEELNIGNPYGWMYRFNSLNIPDGPIELHYIVYDKAGNLNHYAQTGFIKNHAPVIDSIKLGTDLNGVFGVEGSEETTFSPASFGATDFTGRNDQLQITINLAAGIVNAPLIYSVTYGGGNLITSGSLADINSSSYSDISLNGAGFICTITDSVGLSASETIYLNLKNTDTVKPTIKFGELDSDTSVPLNGGVKEGHIEERSWSKYNNGSGLDPDVSGIIIFNGSAHDEQRIQNLYIGIDLNNNGNILDSGEKILIADPDTDGTLKNISPALITSQSLSESGGHDVSFTYVWDSSGLTDIAGNDVDIRLVAEDYNSNFNVLESYPAAEYDLMTVDVVPYISKIKTSLSSAYLSNPSVFDRSSLGFYPTYENEIIEIEGFNFNGPTTAVTVNGSTAGVVVANVTSADPKHIITVDVGSSVISGNIQLMVNSVQSINNLNDNSQDSNKEANGMNNDILTDDRSLEIWNFNLIGSTATARFPIMKISSGDKIGFSYADGETEVSVNDNGTRRVLENSYTRYNYTTMNYDDDGNYYAIGLNSDRVSDTDSSRTTFFSRNYNSNSWHYNTGSGKRQFEHNYNGTTFNSLRSQYPDLEITGDGTGANLYLSYYDDSMNAIKFRYFSVGAANNTITGAMANWNTANSWSADGFHTIADATDSGAYSAVGVTSNNEVVVAWYDATARSLKLAYNTDPSLSSDWTNQITIDSYFAGMYVDVAVDADDGIHIAYYNSSNGDLKYAYLSSYDDSTADVYTVDSFLSVGQNLMIDIIEEGGQQVPYISYYVGSYAGTMMSIRYASWNTALAMGDGVALDKFTGNWRISSVPARNIPKDYIVSSGSKSAGEFIIGYATDSGLETAERK